MVASATPLFLGSAQATHDPNDFFVLETAFPGYNWQDVHGTSATNVFAVGDSAGVSAIAHRTGTGWALQAVPNHGTVFRVWAQSTTNAYATYLGGTGLILHYDGISWTTFTSPINFTVHVWGLSATDIGFGGIDFPNDPGIAVAEVIRYNGVGFIGAKEICSAGKTQINWIYGNSLYRTSASLGIAASTSSRPAADTNCAVTDDLTSAQTTDGWAPTDVLGSAIQVGPRGGIDRESSPAWIPLVSPTQQDLWAVWGLSATDIWAVGDAGTIIHKAAGDFALEPSVAVSNNLQGVYFSDASNGWTVSNTGNIFKLQVNPALGHPSVAGLNYDSSEGVIEVSQAQCLGDDIDITIINAQGAINDLDVYIIDGETDIAIEQIDDSQMFAHGNSWWHFNRTYPSGSYQALMIIDIQAVLVPDRFDVVPFNVPVGSCFTAGDRLEIQNRLDDLGREVAHINSTTLRTERNVTQVNLTVRDAHAHIDAHLAHTNGIINASTTLLFNHIVSRTSYTNQLINDTLEGATFNITVASGIANETVNLLANEFGLQLGETTTLNILIILLMVVIGVWLWRKQELVLRVTGTIIVFTAGFIALTVATAWNAGALFAATILFFAAGLMIYLAWGERQDRRNRRGRKSEEMEL